ncbi:MAG: RluA family pseudouridine synthase [Pseudomonadota bacterium]
MAALNRFDPSWLLYADDDFLVVDKPSGLSVLKDRTGSADLWTLAEAYFGPLKLVHRIDKGTSGVIVLARRAEVQKAMTQAFAARTTRKRYLARVVGALHLAGTATLDLPLRKGRKNRYRIAAPRDAIHRSGDHFSCESDGGAAYPATTRARLVRREANSSVLMLGPQTGRTHQLRVHLAWIGHAIVGDTLYGTPRAPEQAFRRLCLHAHSLELPGFGRFVAPRPAFAARQKGGTAG